MPISDVCRRQVWARLLVTILLIALLGSAMTLPGLATVSGVNGQIAFVSHRDGNPEIYLMRADGSDPINLTNHPAEDYGPSWSPDGRQIAFFSDRDGEFAVYSIEVDGSGLHRLAPGHHPAWSPDGARIAFVRDDAIISLLLDGGETRITDPSMDPNPPRSTIGISDSSPAWSPDGTRIAFVRHYLGPSPTAQTSRLYAVDAQAGATPIRLADLAWSAAHPDWSPDGSTIVVEEISTHSLSSQVLLVDAGGSGKVGLPTPAEFDHASAPGWSPDGSRLVAAMYRVNFIPGDIFVMRADGSNPVNLTNHPAGDYEPSWQPFNPYPVGLVDPTAGIWYLRNADGHITSFYYGVPGDIPFMGDWDCDGIETPGLYRQSDGFVYLRNTNTQGIADIAFFFGNPSDVPIPGDFDGDGCDTISIYRPSEARIYVINRMGSGDAGLGAAEYSYLFGDRGDKPFVGDFDGDGIDTVGLHRETTGKVYYRDGNTQGIADNTFIYGNPGDRLVAFDWNANGIESPAVFRPGNSTFYFRFTNSDGVADARYIWGESNWLPVAGDFK